MKILNSSSTQVTADNFSVTRQEWIANLKGAFFSESKERLEKHGFLYLNGRTIQVSISSLSSNLNIDEIVKISRCFLSHQGLSLEELDSLKECYKIIQMSAAQPKSFWTRLYEKVFHAFRGEHFVDTHTLLSQELIKIKEQERSKEELSHFSSIFEEKLEKKLVLYSTFLRDYSNEGLQELISLWKENPASSMNRLEARLDIIDTFIQGQKKCKQLQSQLDEYKQMAQNETDPKFKQAFEAYIKSYRVSSMESDIEEYRKQKLHIIIDKLNQDLKTKIDLVHPKKFELSQLKNRLNAESVFNSIEKELNLLKQSYDIVKQTSEYIKKIQMICSKEFEKFCQQKNLPKFFNENHEVFFTLPSTEIVYDYFAYTSLECLSKLCKELMSKYKETPISRQTFNDPIWQMILHLNLSLKLQVQILDTTDIQSYLDCVKAEVAKLEAP